MKGKEKYRPTKASFGGDVSDFLGTLLDSRNENYTHQSLNPQGNRFAGLDTKEMITEMVSIHGKDSLEILDARIDEFFGISDDRKLPEDMAEQYSEVKTAIKETLEATENPNQ